MRSKLKMVFSHKLECKIRTLCSLLPSTEWGGAVFYKYVNSKSSSSMEDTVLYVEDFCLQDVGNAGYTEYDLDKETASYYAQNIDTLLGCKVGLLHSHNSMSAFFSSRDLTTLHEQAVQCNNTLSIVVNNAGSYVARFTEQHLINQDIKTHKDITEKDFSKYMGDQPSSLTRKHSTDNSSTDEFIEIRCWECDIEKPSDASVDEELKTEYQELIKTIRDKKHSAVVSPVNLSSEYNIDLFNESYSEYTFEKDIAFMTYSILYLSFDSWYLYYLMVGNEGLDLSECEIVIDEDCSPVFLGLFMKAWYSWYTPSAKQINKIINGLKKAKIPKRAAPVIFNYLNYRLTNTVL